MSRFSKESIERAKATGELPHEFLLRVARGQAIYKEVVDLDAEGGSTSIIVQELYTFEDRKDAAKAAAPYFAPKLSAVEVLPGVSDSELDDFIAQLATQAGFVPSAGGAPEANTQTTGNSGRRRARLTG